MKTLFNRRVSHAFAGALSAIALMHAAGAIGQTTAAGGGYSAAEDTLLGGPGAAGGYADPYGTDKAAAPNKAKGKGAGATGADNMLDNDNGGQTTASFVKPGSVVYKSTRKGKAMGPGGATNGGLAGGDGLPQAPVTTRKPVEIYKSPY